MGQVDEGVSGAHYVRAVNGNEYIMKGASFSPALPYVAANEWIAAELGVRLGLPILDHQILEMGGMLFFGSRWMPQGTFYPYASERQVRSCENCDVLYDILVFDTWICNMDRHARNLIIRQAPGRDGKKTVHPNDHSHCLIHPTETPGHLAGKLTLGAGNFVRWNPLRQMIVMPSILQKSIAAVESVSDEEICSVVRCTPVDFLKEAERGDVIDYLVGRRARLRAAFITDRASFPRLRKGEL